MTQKAAILNQETLAPIFAKGIIVSLKPNPTGKLATHPVESGASVSDHYIKNPLELSLALACVGGAYADVYAEILQAFKNRTLIAVQGQVDTYTNLIIESWPHTENADRANGTLVEMQLKEFVKVAAQYGKFTNTAPANRSTTNTGTQQPVKKQSVARALFGP